MPVSKAIDLIKRFGVFVIIWSMSEALRHWYRGLYQVMELLYETVFINYKLQIFIRPVEYHTHRRYIMIYYFLQKLNFSKPGFT